MTTRIPTFPADIVYETALGDGPLQASPPPWWTGFTAKWLGRWDAEAGRDFELDRNMTGTLRPALDNRSGDLDPTNPVGTFYPGLAPYVPVRIRTPFGANCLTVDQATAGEQTGYSGQVPAQLNVASDAAFPAFQIVASGSAYQGTQVYQAALSAGATVGASPLRVTAVPVVPNRAYSFQAQCRIPSGNSVSTQAEILWFNQAGTQVATVAGTAQTLTSGSSTWVQLAASGTAPQGVFSAQLRVQIAAGTLASTTTWQVDGLQWEESATPTAWQIPDSVSANLLPRQIATGTATIDPTKDTAAAWFYPVAGSVAQATNLTAAPTSHTTAVAWTTPSGTTSASPLYAGVAGTGAPAAGPVADTVQVTATTQYTFSGYLMRLASADATVQVQAQIAWYDAAGNALTPSSGAAVTVAAGSWVRATVTASAPTGAVWGRPRFAITTPASTTATNTLYAAGLQFEQAAAASTWTDPGFTGYPFWGNWEQFPQLWRLSGTWGELDATMVDALAGLAKVQIGDPFLMELGALAANFVYPLNDPASATSCSDATGKRAAAPIEVSPYGAGSLTLGSSITSNAPGSGFLGGSGPVATFANPAVAGTLTQTACTFISLDKATNAPGPPPTGGWSRLVAFRIPSTPTNVVFLWQALPVSWLATNSSQFSISMNTFGFVTVNVFGAAGVGGSVQFSSQNFADGNWHLVTVSLSAAGTTLTASLDGSVSTAGPASDAHPTGIASDKLGASVEYGLNQFTDGVAGDMALAAELPLALTSAQISNVYGSWRTASAGDSTGARFQRLLTWIGWTGPTRIDTGLTTSMGPATDLVGQSGLDGAFAIATTENGDVFADAGTLVFQQRSALYNSQPAFVFGERQQYGEWPYEDVQLPVDPLHTYSTIQAQQWSTGQIATARDAASALANYPATLPTVTVNESSFAAVVAASQYLLARYKSNRMRCKGLKLHLSAVPGLWRVAAQLTKGTRIRVMKRPPYRPTSAPIQFDGFVQKKTLTFDPRGEAWLTIEASPADLNTYWTLAALHTTLSAQASSGQNQATINALPDAASNKLSQSLPSGYQLVFEPGSPRQETMTLSPTGIPSTSLSYSTAVLTFTSNFAFTHPANSTVCEPIPQGYTDPTTWDANSQLGAASTTVISGGASGTATVTVGPLPDAATNALGSNWNEGDQITLSPGTPNSETATILSAAATVPGYTSCQLTLTANLAHSHAAADTVCDLLPGGVTAPPTGTCRVAY